ncbi:MAG: DUF2147 domain-containing protein [Bacteroidota bacterium]
MQATKITIIILMMSLCSIARQHSGADDIVGVWQVGSKEARVTIFKTGNYYYGKISWLKNPNDDSGKPKTDIKNHDEQQRGKHVMGLLLLKSFEYNAHDNIWENGTIYDPKNGKTYSCKLTMTNMNTLEVRGYVGISMIGRTDIWTKVE